MTLLAAPTPSTPRHSLRMAPGTIQTPWRQGPTGTSNATSPRREPRPAIDGHDATRDHLTVHDGSGSVVGRCQLLPPHHTARLSADDLFDLGPITPLRGNLVETGPAWVHPDHPTDTVTDLIWFDIVRYMHRCGHRWLAGCVSVPLTDGGTTASELWRLGRQQHPAPPIWQVRPHHPWPGPAQAATDPPTVPVAPPALLRGYLRLGAWISGPPAHNRHPGTADFFILLSLDRVDPRYLKR